MNVPESLHPWIAVGAVVLVFVVLQVRRGVPTDMLFLAALLLVTATGVLTPEQAFEGFANPAILTIAGLLAVTAGLRVTGVLDWVGRRLLGSAHTERQALYRLAPTLVASSAFILNTALVAMMMPVVLDWCRRRGISPSRLLIPLSYITILGGVCTLIGTSTTLVVQAKLGPLRDEQRVQVAATQEAARGSSQAEDVAERGERFLADLRPMTLFELGLAGFPCAVAGSLFMVFVGPRLLPNRTDLIERLGEHRREYLVEMAVQGDCPLVGQTIEQAGLRHLPGLFLIEIDRDGNVITPVAPEDILQANDRLVFTGVVGTIVDLEKIRGLVPAADRHYEHNPALRQQRHLTEVVISRTSPIIGQTVREANFRRLYNAAVIAVHRNGVRLTNKIGDIHLEPGDTLLLQTRSEFVSTYRNHRDFYLVSAVHGAETRLHHKMPLCALLAALLIVWLIATSFFVDQRDLGLMSPPVAALSITVLLILTRCMRMTEARNAIDVQLFITIAAALGLGQALTESGAADSLARGLVSMVGSNPYLLLILIYVITALFTETITNSAVAAMLLPLAVFLAWNSGYSPRPFIIAVTLAASLSFMTPIGYQSNLMVMGPGGYRPLDYLRCGVPLAITVGVVALLIIPNVWPF